jgi:prophage regulatory protein
MIRLPEVIAICGLSRSNVYAYTKRGEFPARVKITRHASAWVRGEVLAWVENRIHASRSCTPNTGRKSRDWVLTANRSLLVYFFGVQTCKNNKGQSEDWPKLLILLVGTE